LKTLDFDPVGLDDDDLLNLALEMFLDVGVHVRLGIEVFFFVAFFFGVYSVCVRVSVSIDKRDLLKKQKSPTDTYKHTHTHTLLFSTCQKRNSFDLP
jgi:hypothetical protein